MSINLENWPNQFCKTGQTCFTKLLFQLSGQVEQYFFGKLVQNDLIQKLSINLGKLVKPKTVIQVLRPNRAIVF